ncbi:MAG: thioesterase family protein [Firmicutes bacterium]|nr:thioesterase family protein [Bacillota bacterium]
MFDANKQKTMILSEYPFQTTDKVRYADTDRQGHVNNSVFHQFFETGRVEFLYHPEHPLYMSGCSFVIASANVDYLKEIKWPGIVGIGTGVTRIGNSSIHLAQAIFQDSKLVAIGEIVIVQVENKTGQSNPLSLETKETLHKFLFTD